MEFLKCGVEPCCTAKTAIKTERTQIHFLSNVLVDVASLDLKVPNLFLGKRVNTERVYRIVLMPSGHPPILVKSK